MRETKARLNEYAVEAAGLLGPRWSVAGIKHSREFGFKSVEKDSFEIEWIYDDSPRWMFATVVSEAVVETNNPPRHLARHVALAVLRRRQQSEAQAEAAALRTQQLSVIAREVAGLT